MKKSIVLSATLAGLSTSAWAQSSVTLYGTMDTSIAYAHASGKGSKTSLEDSGENASRFGFLGTEDLGGGLSAGFTLESDVYPSDGAIPNTNSNNQKNGVTSAMFDRRSFVNLTSKTLGELRFGRDYSPSYWNLAKYDPFVHEGIGSAAVRDLTDTGITGVRTSNTAFYLTPDTLGGFFAEVAYGFGNNPQDQPGGTGHDGDYSGFRIGYIGHGANVAVAGAKTTYLAGDVRVLNGGGTYDFNIFKAYGFYQQAEVGGIGSQTQSTILLGGSVPVGVNAIRFSAIEQHIHGNSSLDLQQIAIGYIYNLSKRTSLYATYAFINNHKNAQGGLQETSILAPQSGGNVNGVQLGISTFF
jgi:predicted porin